MACMTLNQKVKKCIFLLLHLLLNGWDIATSNNAGVFVIDVEGTGQTFVSP